MTENDLFLMLRTLFSESRFMPGKRSWDVPVMSWGRPAAAGVEPLDRSGRQCGSTLYLTASINHRRCSSRSFSGNSADRSSAWVQSLLPS